MTITDQPLVSIVTPVYNGENFIEECIQSVCNQTYQNWEYILVNNCSTDKTPEIAKKYTAKDDRIRLINTTKLLPLISNHNYALQQISSAGKYCKMVHADDILFPSCVESMVASAESHPTAGIVGSYSLWGKKIVSDGIPLNTTFFTGTKLSRLNLLDEIYCFWSPSALMIRSDLIRRRRNFYNGDHLYSDVEACYEILQAADFAFVHQVLTFIRSHDQSATKTITETFGTTILSNMDLYLKYGPVYLSKEEFNAHLQIKMKKYYRFLANSLFNLREKDFWHYHKEACQKIGIPFNQSKLIKTSILLFLGHPLVTIRKLIKKHFDNHSNKQHSGAKIESGSHTPN